MLKDDWNEDLVKKYAVPFPSLGRMTFFGHIEVAPTLLSKVLEELNKRMYKRPIQKEASVIIVWFPKEDMYGIYRLNQLLPVVPKGNPISGFLEEVTKPSTLVKPR